jgi:hypothetical protein
MAPRVYPETHFSVTGTEAEEAVHVTVGVDAEQKKLLRLLTFGRPALRLRGLSGRPDGFHLLALGLPGGRRTLSPALFRGRDFGGWCGCSRGLPPGQFLLDRFNLGVNGRLSDRKCFECEFK